MTPAEEKRELAKKNNGQPVFWRAGAWEFGLSYGTPKAPPSREEFEIGNVTIAASLRSQVPDTYEEFVKAWHEDVEAFKDAKPRWILSAMLYPRGRSSSEKEWDFLGVMTLAVGVPDPRTCALTPIETTHPNAVHYWMWEDP